MPSPNNAVPLVALVVSVFAFRAGAQPVIASTDAPAVGMSYPYVECMPYAGLFQLNWQITGPDAVWHLSTVLNVDSGTLDIIDPGSSACTDSFPGADVAMRFPGSRTEFDSITGESVFSMGYCYEVPDQSVVYGTVVRSMVWPCTYMTSWSDQLAWTWPLSGHHITGVRHDTVDGYGMLELPWGTVPGVLAIRELDTTYMSPGNDTVPHVRWGRRFVRPGWPVDIARIWTGAPGDSLGYSGPHGGGYLSEEVFQAIAEAEEGTSLSLSWDPVTDRLIVALPPGTQGEVFIVELSGRVVFQSGWSGPLIATDHLASGIYVVRFFDHTSRRVRAERFVKYR